LVNPRTAGQLRGPGTTLTAVQREPIGRETSVTGLTFGLPNSHPNLRIGDELPFISWFHALVSRDLKDDYRWVALKTSPDIGQWHVGKSLRRSQANLDAVLQKRMHRLPSLQTLIAKNHAAISMAADNPAIRKNGPVAAPADAGHTAAHMQAAVWIPAEGRIEFESGHGSPALRKAINGEWLVLYTASRL
jgi:hypothetical protein